MKCFVCEQEYEGQDCPRCHFPNVQVPGASREKAIRDLAPAINSFRSGFLQSILVEAVSYHWRDEQGQVVLDHEAMLPLGNGTKLYGQQIWLDQKFARVEELTRIPVRLRITVGGNVREAQVEVDNLKEPGLQQLGVSLGQDFQIQVMLRNDAGAKATSAPVPL